MDSRIRSLLRASAAQAFLHAVGSIAHAQSSAPPSVSIVPLPVESKRLDGTFLLDGRTQIVATDAESRRIAGLLNEYLFTLHGVRLPIGSKRLEDRNSISLTQDGSRALPEEGYRLVVEPKQIRLIGRPAGLFYGVQTLLQLLPAAATPTMEIPGLEITDSPRFGYRGVLLDVGRHYFSVATVKKVLDLAAQYKINRFHWHLTDNEGWRIEIRKYPQLTPAGSQYYTQEQIRDVVAYARARFITIVPEIEMPGHSGAATAAYPRLTCSSGDYANVLCPREESFTFVRNVLQEVIALFPGPFIHIGGDEVDKEGWRQSAEAQAIMSREGLRTEEELQAYFIRHVSQFVRARGKRMIGWDEILEGGLAPNAIVMSWRGEGGGIEAARQKHAVIMAPTDYTYFDYYQGDPAREPESIGGFVPLEKAYAYEPIPKDMSPQDRQYVLGAQANLWTEYVATPEHLEYMLFPRLLAFAEAVWSPSAVRNYDLFRGRLTYQLARLDKQDVHFRIPEPLGLQDFYTTTDDDLRLELTSLVTGSQMYYTLDGSTPTDSSARYEAPLQIPLPQERKTKLNLLVVAPNGRRSVPYEATFLKSAYLDAIRHDSPQPGLAFALYDGPFATVRTIGEGVQAAAGITSSFDPQQFGRMFDFGTSWAGYVNVPSDSFYQFAVESDDGAVLRIDGNVVVDNDGNHSSRLITGHIPLRQGFHSFELRYFQARGGATLRVSWAPSGAALLPLDVSALFH
jgi:hexosaminidase